jgi:hypothetical protein
MPDQSNENLAKSREFLSGFQHELDRFEQYELSLLQEDRKEREAQMAARFSTLSFDASFRK